MLHKFNGRVNMLRLAIFGTIALLLFHISKVEAKVLVPAYAGGYPVTVCQANDTATGCSGVAGTALTPWTSNINGGGYNLTNVGILSTTNNTLDDGSGNMVANQLDIGSSGSLGWTGSASAAIDGSGNAQFTGQALFGTGGTGYWTPNGSTFSINPFGTQGWIAYDDANGHQAVMGFNGGSFKFDNNDWGHVWMSQNGDPRYINIGASEGNSYYLNIAEDTATFQFATTDISGVLSTTNNTLDDGSGNAHFVGSLSTAYNTLDDGSGNASFAKNVLLGNGTSKGSQDVFQVYSGTPGPMQFPYEVSSVERNGDTKFGIYTSVNSATDGGASLTLGFTNVTDGNYYPGFEMQEYWDGTGTFNGNTNKIRFNALGRDSDGNVVASNADVLDLYGNGSVNTKNNTLDDGSGNLTAVKLVKSGGTSSQFLKADGSVDSSTYLPYKTKGTITLVSGTKALTISGVTTSNQAFVQLVTPGGTLGGAYKAVCTSNTLTVTSIGATGTTITTDTSTLNYLIV